MCCLHLTFVYHDCELLPTSWSSLLSNILLAGFAPVYSVAAQAAPSVQDDAVLLGTQFPKPGHPEDKKPCDGRRKRRPTLSMRRAETEAKSAGLMHFCCMRCAKAIFFCSSLFAL